MTWEIFGTDHLGVRDPAILCPCGDWVPSSVAYRDGPKPFHWNSEGGGHTMEQAAWDHHQLDSPLDTPSDWHEFLTEVCRIYIPLPGNHDLDPF